MKKFEKGFLIGTSTAAHQVEGNNIYSDCWVMENIRHTLYADRSGDAVDHYNRYEEDIKLMAAAGFNAYRFSIEWARIEPQEGVFDAGEVEHYRKVIACCKENGLEPMIVLHHFSSPAWLISKGGWENEAVIDWFVRYCRYVIERLGHEGRFVCTINEANIRLQIADIMKRYDMAATSKTLESASKDAESSLQMGMNFKDPLLPGFSRHMHFYCPASPTVNILLNSSVMSAICSGGSSQPFRSQYSMIAAAPPVK